MKNVNVFLSVLCAILALVSVSAVAEDSAYRFEVDRKPRDLWVRSVFGEADKPALGDLIYVCDIPPKICSIAKNAVRGSGRYKLLERE